MASVVPEARFKLLDVPNSVSIKGFAASRGLKFAAGKGFYELMKPEVIQAYKEIVAVRKSDGLKVSGAKVRELLNIPSGAAKFRLDAELLTDFKIFVQSTSHNRVLIGGTEFLYEVDADATDDAPRAVDVSAAERPAPPPGGAGMPIEIAFSFDTTGSMSSILGHVRSRLQELIVRLQNDIPGLRIAVFAHGDYCDERVYITKFVDFTTDADKLCKFVGDVGATGGGDAPECYELVLKEAREKLSWTPGTQRALVMIGDASPHELQDYKHDAILKRFPPISWREEVDKIIRELGCRIYSIQCKKTSSRDADVFWKHMAYHTHGYHLNMDNFANVLDFIMAICYREQGGEQLQAYRAEVEERSKTTGGINSDLHRLFESLASGGSVSAPESAALLTVGGKLKRKSAAVPAEGTKADAGDAPKGAKVARIGSRKGAEVARVGSRKARAARSKSAKRVEVKAAKGAKASKSGAKVPVAKREPKTGKGGSRLVSKTPSGRGAARKTEAPMKKTKKDAAKKKGAAVKPASSSKAGMKREVQRGGGKASKRIAKAKATAKSAMRSTAPFKTGGASKRKSAKGGPVKVKLLKK